MNKQRKLLLAALAAGSITCAVPAFAAVDVYVDVAPPAPRHEVVPAPRHGYIWQPGYWDYDHGRHAWHKGYWVKERRGYYWHPARWEERNGRYHFVKGRWDRERYAENRWNNGARGDRDHDGVPNKFDRDKDGDGVPNRYDDSPNNPHRR
nr:putative lipoprotein [uncultured bacterium]